MSGGQTAEEARNQYVTQMGAELGTAYDTLRNDVTWGFVLWGTYKELFGTPEKISLLSNTAGTFFWILQTTLLDYMVLLLARLVDKPSTGRKTNLTLQRLPLLIPDEQLRTQVEELVQTARDQCQAAVDWRNRRLAHRDLHVAQATAEALLPEITSDDVTNALDSFAHLLNRLELHYNNGATVMYEHTTVQGGGAESLVFFLERGLRAEQADLGEL